MGGDQLTASRGRGAQSIRMNDSDPVSCLEGLEMFPLDWHVKMNLLEVRMFKLIYTFEILQNVIGRINVTISLSWSSRATFLSLP